MILRILLAVILIVTFIPDHSAAQPTGGTGTPPAGGTGTPPGGTGTPPGGTGTPPAGGTGTTGGTCDFSALKQSLRQTESSGRQCEGYSGSASTRYGPTGGIYQFIPPTWESMARGCPNAANCGHAVMRTGAAQCCVTQECAMDNLLASNLAGIRRNQNCQSLLGRTINSPRYGSCTVTMSGLVAAWHLGGTNACNGPANGGYGDSDGHTTEADYICRHSGHPVPEDCTPAQQGDPNIAPPVGTGQQIDSYEGQGEVVLPGPADPLKDWWVAGLMLMAEQFTINMEAQVQAIGMLLDAKHQLETQRLFQLKMAEAHKDYQPSEQLCTFGTFARDLAGTERTAEVTKLAIANDILKRDLGSGDTQAVTDVADRVSRIAQFRNRFCSQSDNGRGLRMACGGQAPAAMQDADINFTQTLDKKLSLEIDLDDGNTTMDEETVFALVDNLFVHSVPPRIAARSMELEKFQYQYMNLRSIIAMRGIARNSIANIIALKTQTPNGQGTSSSAPYLRALMVEFGLTEAEINLYLGENPSYYAQMELLTKKIYQSPNFYAMLYDKPANVERLRAAMVAIKLMQDRDIQDALQRREMLLSMMLELRLREQAESVYDATERALFDIN